MNNAGSSSAFGPLWEVDPEDWWHDVTVNLRGTLLCTHAILPGMLARRHGHIVAISSLAALRGLPGQMGYCASKAGLIGLTKSNAREMAKRSITVNAVAPGFIATAMTDALSDKVRAELTAQIPLERLGSADDIANAVVFLASEAAGYITGHVLSVNGGMYM